MSAPSNFEQILTALAELLTAKHDHGSWKPGIIISYLGGKPEESWYISLSEFCRVNTHSAPEKTVLFKGKFSSLREALKAAAEFLVPTKLEELKNRIQSLAAKL